MDWNKKMTRLERYLFYRGYPRRNKILFHVEQKIFKERTAKSSISIDPNAQPRLTIISVGNSHLDSAWKWRKEDAHQKKTFPTFSRALFHMKIFPNFTFSANATVHYEWIEDISPQTFQEIKDAVENGQWELVGGEYVESDVNLVDGESLVRQRLIGQRYYLHHFHRLADIAWMDDVFGFCLQLPQLLAKSGGIYFYTNKFCYSNISIKHPPESPKYTGGEKFPFLHFNWMAPDGSKILVTWAQHKNNFPKHLEHFTKHSRTVKPEEDNCFNYTLTWQEMDAKCSDEVVQLIVNAYGHGDGGMGPRPLEILEQMVWEQLGYVQNAPIKKFFQLLRPYQDRLPNWCDEMYLENHQGTLTSVGMVKENNHTAEVLLHLAESLSTFAGLFGKDHFQDEFEDDWKKILFLQFHDVLPGSSIVEVYRDAATDYNQVIRHLASCHENAIMNLAESLKTGEKKSYWTIYNGLGWARGGYVLLPKQQWNFAADGNGTALITQTVRFSSYTRNREIQVGIVDVPGTNYLATIEGLPELTEYEAQAEEWLLIHLPKADSLPSYGMINLSLMESAPKAVKSMVSIEEQPPHFLLKNNLVSITLDKQTGRITHYHFNGIDSAVLGPLGIGYRIFKDDPTEFDAWNIDPNYRTKEVQFPGVDSIIIEEKGPLRVTLLVKYCKSVAGATYHTRFSLYHNDPKLYGELLVDWQEEYHILKLALDTQLTGKMVHCGTPFGIQQRPAIPRTAYQEAMFEYPFQQFAYLQSDLTPDGNCTGIAMYSQSKFGMWVSGGLMEMTLLKAPHFAPADKNYATLDPDAPHCPVVDRGFHRIPWAVELIPKSKTLMDIVRTGYEYNIPPIGFEAEYAHSDTSFISCDQPNVILHTVKEIEAWMRDAPDWFYNPGMNELVFIIRCVEYLGQETKCSLQLDSHLDIKRVQEVDLLERIHQNGIASSDAKYENHEIKFTIRPYEIKSLMIFGRQPTV
jgi:alpha-mannosidase